MEPRSFYTLADASYFLGLAALVNSLRLLGHDEPIVVLDCGLTDRQRELVEPEATLVLSPPGLHPSVARAHAALLHPARAMILVDSDIIVTRALTELFEEALSGRIVVFEDNVAHRFDPRWPGLLGLPPQHRHPYVNGGLIALSDASLPFLEEYFLLSRGIDARHSIFTDGVAADPFYYLDQDVFNALLGSRLRPDEYVVHDLRLAPHPPFAGVKLISVDERHCAYEDGVEPFVLHHVLRKPWLAHTRSTVYSRLLSRLLLASDLAVTPPVEWVPLRLRTGPAARVARVESHARSRLHEQRGRLGVRRRLAGRRVR
jgi:hypothetical protein